MDWPLWLRDMDKKALLDERRRLLDRKFAGPWTRADDVRLQWIRWQLDRFDAAGLMTN